MNSIRITRHAIDRSKERLGLSRRAVQRHIHKVVSQGVSLDACNDKAKRTLLLQVQSGDNKVRPFIYGNHVFVMVQSRLELVFVTVIHQ